MKKLQSTASFGLMHALYWSACCAFSAFFSPVLLGLGYNHVQVGTIVAAGSFLVCVFQFLWGYLCSGKLQLKWVYTTCLLASILVIFPLMRVNTYRVTLVLAALMAILFQSMSSIGDAWNVNLMRENPKISFSIARGAASTAYAIVVVLLGWAVNRFGYGLLPAVFAVCAGLAAVVALLHKAPAAAVQQTGSGSLAALSANLKNPSLILFYCSATIVFVAFGANNCFYPVLMEQVGGATAVGIGLFFTAISESAMMVLLYPRLKSSKSNLLIFSMIMIGAKNVMIGLISSPTLLLAVQLMQALGTGILFSAAVDYVNQKAPAGCTTMAVTLYSALCLGLGTMAGNYLGGILSDRLGLHGMFLITGFISIGGALIFALTQNRCKNISNN